ncbi:MAG: hypothetical protein LQ351_007076 [Letrouitia transgressa]|nr:MAG: hypothetical protein LQ351_007076 [Letrouitia transgressa]
MDSNHDDQQITIEHEMDEKYPHRPRNHSKTLPFHDLLLILFNPLNENKKKPTGPAIARKKLGPHGPLTKNPHEVRQHIVERFISKWRQEVGNDIFPAFRLIIPEKDRERAMYGLKEKTIGKLLIRVMKINKESEDGYSLLNWKQPGQSGASRMAGDFAGRCYEVITKRPMRTEVGNMSIGEVNDLLDKLSVAQKEDAQLPIFREFYNGMNADELMWLIRIILRQMKVGATEKTFFNIWHPDAESLFNVSSNLRRVCWELYDPHVRLEGDDRGIALMQCFQPQLAQFQMHNIPKMIARLRPTEDDPVFWIEEKLDGERMQLHMVSDDNVVGGKKFAFWSRKAKDYTYLYGNSFRDPNSALTQHIKDVFHENVRNVILDGEMITWDPEEDAMVPFGTLKTAALDQQRNPFSQGYRPLFRVFDILYLNDQPLTSFTLRDRRKALEASVRSVPRRLEIHEYIQATSPKEVEKLLQRVVLEASEGLVLKNPRSSYRLNDRNDDWMKVKPEYLTEYGEALDCIVIGGYYGSGRRGGYLSSFLCGLRVDENQVQRGANPMKCYSFFKVGGGFAAPDYADIRHRTEGKWKRWDPKKPPAEFVELGGGSLQYERPDVWIMPNDSVVLSVKAATVTASDSFRTGYTLRFPRFMKLRTDRDWKTAVSLSEFAELKNNVEAQVHEKQMKIDDSRRRKQRLPQKKPLIVAGSKMEFVTPYNGPTSMTFDGMSLFVMSDQLQPEKRSKGQLEQIIKANGGRVLQKHDAVPNTVCIGDRNNVKVASVIKQGGTSIVRPLWIFDCLRQAEIDASRPIFPLPLEPRHIFHASEEANELAKGYMDKYQDSYNRSVDVAELRKILETMVVKIEKPVSHQLVRSQLQERSQNFNDLPGSMFRGLVFSMQDLDPKELDPSLSMKDKEITEPSKLRIKKAFDTARFGGARIAAGLADEDITHVILSEQDRGKTRAIREQIYRRERLPRVLLIDWVEQSWAERTVLDEERMLSWCVL